MQPMITNTATSYLTSCVIKTTPMVIADVSQIAIALIFLDSKRADVPIALSPFITIVLIGSSVEAGTSAISAALAIKLGELFFERRPSLLRQYGLFLSIVHLLTFYELMFYQDVDRN